MRIVAGRLGGRRLAGPPRGAAARPTPDRVREAIFSILGESVRERTVLDVFAGTGALGIEALSRGARHAYFVERDRRMALVLARNVADLGLEEQADLLVMDWRRAVERLERERARVDLVLADPPYDGGDARSCLTRLAASEIVRVGSRLVVEHAARRALDPGPEAEQTLQRVDDRRYGDTAVSIFERR